MIECVVKREQFYEEVINMLEKLKSSPRLQAIVVTGVVLIGIAWISDKMDIDLT